MLSSILGIIVVLPGAVIVGVILYGSLFGDADLMDFLRSPTTRSTRRY